MNKKAILMGLSILFGFSLLSGYTECRAQTISENEESDYFTEETYTQNDEKQIYGILYCPSEQEEKMPAVIFSHGFNGTHEDGKDYAEALVKKGYVVYCYDFCGGSTKSMSDGDTEEMSIFTEQQDLEAVLGMVENLDYVDNNRIFLLGESQGSVVSAITAAAHKEEIAGMILNYPAFVLVDNAKKSFETKDDIPDQNQVMGMTIGKTYYEKLLDYDVYDVIKNYDKDVLIIHGDADQVAPISYSEKAVETYPSASLQVIPGAKHGFKKEEKEKAIEFISEYLDEHSR